MFPLSAASLYRATVDFSDGRRSSISLFPLFDQTGKVHRLVVVSDEPARIFVLPWRAGLVEKPWLGPLRLKVLFRNLEDVTEDEAHNSTIYWHYDPWWQLLEPHLCEHEATPALRTTNAVDELKGVTSLSFARDLSCVAWLTEQQGQNIVQGPLAVERLPARQPEEYVPRRKSRPGAWRLQPFWAR